MTHRMFDSTMFNKCQPFLFFYLLLLQNAAATAEDLSRPILVQVVFRHGLRNFVTYPTFPTDSTSDSRHSVWHEVGELTQLGRKQMNEVGRNLKKTYGFLLAENYVPSMLHVLAGNLNRTVESAYAMLAGWGPMGSTSTTVHTDSDGWRPIPVHTDINMDLATSPFASLFECPEYRRRLFESSTFQRLQTKYAKLMAFVADKTGQPMDSVFRLKDYVYELEQRRVWDLPRPKWDDGVMIPNGTFHMVQTDWARLMFDQPKATRLLASWLFTKIVSGLRYRVHNNTNHRLLFYSAHDFNILALGYFMDVANVKENYPDLGSYLAFELYNRTGRFEVKFAYSAKVGDKASYVTVNECPAPCWLDTFTQLADSDDGSYCGEQETTTQQPCTVEHTSSPIIPWFLTLLMTVFLAVTVYFVLSYRSQLRRLRRGEKQRLLDSVANSECLF